MNQRVGCMIAVFAMGCFLSLPLSAGNKPPLSGALCLDVSGVSLAVGDVDEDGTTDLAVAGGEGWPQGHITVLHGKGDGSFTEREEMTPDILNPQSVLLLDLNGDG